MVTSPAPAGHLDPPGTTVGYDTTTERVDSTVPVALDHTVSTVSDSVERPRRPVGRPLSARPSTFAPGGNSDAAAWALAGASAHGFTPGETRAFQVHASYAEFAKDERGEWIGVGTWDRIYPTLGTVARQARVSRRTVDRMIEKARAARLMALDGTAPHKPGEYAANRYRLSGTPVHPLPVDVLMARAERDGELWDLEGRLWPNVAGDTDGTEDQDVTQPSAAPVENLPADAPAASSYLEFGVPAEQDFGALPKIPTGDEALTSDSNAPVVQGDESLSRPAVGVRSHARATSERKGAATRPVSGPRRQTDAGRPHGRPEGHPVPQGELELALYELTERMTLWQRNRTLDRAMMVMGLERLSVEQLAYRVRANLRMIGGGNRARSPYGVACTLVFRRQYGCDDPRCENGRLFDNGAIQVCPRCTERRRDKAAENKRRAVENAERAAAGLPRLPEQQASPQRPTWCGRCDERTRMIEFGDAGLPIPCPCRTHQPTVPAQRGSDRTNGSVRGPSSQVSAMGESCG